MKLLSKRAVGHSICPPKTIRVATTTKKSHVRTNRNGATAVEFALTVPLMIVVAWACVELTRYNLVKNVANQAAFEGARVGVKPGGTVEEVEAEARNQLKYLCNSCEVQVTPDPITQATSEITVVVQVDIREQGWIAPQFFSDPILEASYTIRRDNVNTY